MAVDIFNDDCLNVMRKMKADGIKIECIVTDPPYGYNFMSKNWDHGVPAAPYWKAAYDLLPPGGHLLAFGGTRTFHRLACIIEDVGFEYRDTLMWLYGSGFPKSLDVSKSMDRKRDDAADVLAVTREINAAFKRSDVRYSDALKHFGFNEGSGQIGHWTALSFGAQPVVPTWDQWVSLKNLLGMSEEMDAEVWRLNGRKGKPGEAWNEREIVGSAFKGSSPLPGNHNGTWADNQMDGKYNITTPFLDAAKQWNGWGTALKPAWEPIIMARKPLNGTVAENVLEYRTGALNIDACRVEGRDRTEYGLSNSTRSQVNTYGKPTESADFDSNKGRWPANLVHDGSDEVEAAFAEFGDRKSCNSPSKARPEGSILGGRRSQGAIYPGEDGSVSRFFYSAKASKEDRADSKHPTVKPINLMRWLVRMVTPPGGTVLDPFAGSGTTLAAAVMEGFNAIGIEKEEEYYNDIVNRMNNVKYDGEIKTEKRNSNKNQTQLEFDNLSIDQKNELLEKMIRGEV